MPKHYKEVVEDIINKMNEAKAMGGKFIVRMKRPGQNTVSAVFDTKAQADAYEKEKKKLGFQIENAFRPPVRYSVKFSMRKGGEIRKASYRDKEGAERFKKMVLAKGGKAIISTEEVQEDAPANSVAGGGVDLAPNAAVSQSPHMIKRKKEQGAEQEKIKDKIKKMIQNNEDNNNIVLKQVLDGLDKVDTKIDELTYGKTEIKEVKEKEYKTFKDKYNA